ncbi:N-acetylmuramoyl-L-alanine amidase [Alphaproteobacteria bacterium]|nr:N-acetylmuramoyl-L-alanine amidase [Alphaproteobacteria bacterium]
MNYSFRKKNKTVKYIILHYTGMKNLQSAYGRLISPLSDVSTHYLVSKEGKIYNLLCPRFKAWHAGKSQWKKDKNLNNSSIGIELENKGHDHGYTKFTSKQYGSLKELINFLKINYRLDDECILFHSDISPNRKKDPGEKFNLDKIGVYRFNKVKVNIKNLPLSKMLILYGFSNEYIKTHYDDCIMAVKRSLKYKKINKNTDKDFKNNFYNLLMQ